MEILAIGFGAPALAGWLALATIPIVIHLLHRQRHRTMDWAAMKWLLAALRKNQRWIRVEQWLLLAVRTLIILLAVLAAMKPTFEQGGAFFAALGPSSHHIIVLDNSMSMQFGEAGVRRFDRAKEIAADILDDARQGDVASVVVMGTSSIALVGEASPYLLSVAEEIEGLRPQDGQARLETAIDPLESIVRHSPTSRRHIYIITDMQRITWMGSKDQGDVAELRNRLVALGEKTSFTILDTSGAESPNLAVARVEQLDPVVIRGRPAVFRATLANHGRSNRDDVQVEVRIDGEVEGVQQVSIPAGEEKSITLLPTVSNPGEHVLEVRLISDSLLADNSRYLVVNVREQIAVLAIDGEPSSEPFRSETDYLQVALSPTSDSGAEGFIRVQMKAESELLDESLDAWDLVVLANVGQLTPNEADALAKFVQRGGGLAFLLGRQVDVGAYNQVLYAEGKGLLPAKLEGVVGTPAESVNHQDATAFLFNPNEYAHPLVADFRGNEQAGLLTTKIFQYIKAALPPTSTAQVAMGFDSGDPAVILSKHGQGLVGVLTTSVDLDWSTWPVSPSYVPIMQQFVQLLIAGRVRRDELRVGETIAKVLPAGVTDIDASVHLPSDRFSNSARPLSEALRPDLTNGLMTLSYGNTERSGVYRFALGPPIGQDWSTAVNTWPEESDLTRVVDDELRQNFPGWDFRLLDRWEPDRPAAVAGSGQSRWPIQALLTAALLLALLEPLLAWQFSHYR